ncbi:FAD-dependent oxidoreductase [Candidatus Bathyarchaeota archaeon]|nr:FAD-dependent oxidoreductase [Candidatus Bathyarchaeota archaeon]
MARKIVIIGAHAAGTDAASAARKTDRSAEITLITDQSVAGYSPCGIPFVIGGHIASFEDLIVFPPSYYKMMKIDLRLETTAKAINVEDKTVEVEDKKGNSETLQYDSLILATGAYPFIPPIKGKEKKGVFTLRTLDDGKRICQALEKSKAAVVIGAGAIGLETAVSFKERGLKTTVVELLPQVCPAALDRDMARIVQRYLEEKGIKIMTGKRVDEVLGDDHVSGVCVDGDEIPADLVLMATGVRPNVKLAKEAGIEIGETGGIKTNLRMETSVKDVYAAGDCAESISSITQRPILSQLGTTAVRQGKVAGINAAGGYSVFLGCLCSFVTKLFDLEIGATGLTEAMAKRVGIETVSGIITSKTRADYYPGGKQIRVKIIADRETERIIGGQIIGGEEVTQRVNALSFAIQKGMTVKELAKADTCYAPPVNETWEPMVLAAEVAMRKL